jgi:hypothetical protein
VEGDTIHDHDIGSLSSLSFLTVVVCVSASDDQSVIEETFLATVGSP